MHFIEFLSEFYRISPGQYRIFSPLWGRGGLFFHQVFYQIDQLHPASDIGLDVDMMGMILDGLKAYEEPIGYLLIT